MTNLRARFTAIALSLGLLVLASVAAAQAAVVVQVRTADGGRGEATVTLTPENGGPARSCTTQNGTCRIPELAAGRYVVSATPIGDGQAPIPRPMPIPPSGEVRLSVTLR